MNFTKIIRSLLIATALITFGNASAAFYGDVTKSGSKIPTTNKAFSADVGDVPRTQSDSFTVNKGSATSSFVGDVSRNNSNAHHE